MLVGAVVGFSFAMFKQEERHHVINQSKEALDQFKEIYHHPSRTIHQLRLRLDQASTSVEQFVNQLDQIEKKLSERADSESR